MTKSYIATATKTGKYWHIEVPEVDSVTQARSLDEADDMVRDLISILIEKSPDTFDIDLHVNLPREAAEARQKAEELRQKAAQYNGDAADYSRRSVALLRVEGFSQKDIATTLGISRQRAAQLSADDKKTRTAKVTAKGRTVYRSATSGRYVTTGTNLRSEATQ